MSHQTTDIQLASHIGVDQRETLDDRSRLTKLKSPTLVFAQAVDKQVPYLISLTVETTGKGVRPNPNWLPTLSPLAVGLASSV